jgi:outer membrane protein assembly factor BamA
MRVLGRASAIAGALWAAALSLASGAVPSPAEAEEPGQAQAPAPAPAPAPAGVEAEGERLEGLAIDALDLAAAPREDKPALLALSGLAAGKPYHAEDVRRAVKLLYQLGRFQNIRVTAERDGNVVRVRLELPPRRTVREISVLAGEVMGASAIKDALGLHTGDELDLTRLPARRLALARVLERRGRRRPAIGLAVEGEDKNGGVELVVKVDEGPSTRLRKLIVRGAPRMALSQLGETLELGYGDVLDLNRVEEGTKRLLQLYRKTGYLDAKILPPEVRESSAVLEHAPPLCLLCLFGWAEPTEEEPEPLADLALEIQAGPEVEVRWKGNHVVPLYELTSAAAPLHEVGSTKSAIDDVRERVLSRYERRGYWRARVAAAVRVTPDGAKKEILFSIDEGLPSRVTQISFPGRPTDPALKVGDAELRAIILNAVQLHLGDEIDRPSADPVTISELVGGSSGPGRRGQPEEPHPPDADPASLYIEKAYKTAVAEIAGLYIAEGYSQVKVDDPLTELARDGRSLHVTIAIKPGVRLLLGDVSFVGNDRRDPSALRQAGDIAPFDPKTGDRRPLSCFKVDEARRAIQGYYKNEGYLFARVEENFCGPGAKMPASCEGQSTCQVAVVFRIHEGPEVHARDVVVRGISMTREDVVGSEVRVSRGKLLRDSDMRQTEQNLLRLGVFQRVSVRPLDEDQEASDKDVVVEVRERKYSALEAGFGVALVEGVRGTLTYSHANVLGTGLRFQTNAELSAVPPPFFLFYDASVRDQIQSFYQQVSPVGGRIAAGLAWPRIPGQPDFGAGLDLGVTRAVNPVFAELTFTAAVSAAYKGLRPELLGRPRQITPTIRLTFDTSNLSCNNRAPQNDVNAMTTGLNTSINCITDTHVASSTGSVAIHPTPTYLGARLGATLDLRDDPLIPTIGLYGEFFPEYRQGLNPDSPNHLKLLGKLNSYLPLPFHSVFAVSVVYQQVVQLNMPDTAIPINNRLFAGGRSTIRGYQETTLLPRDIGTAACQNFTLVDKTMMPGATMPGAQSTLSPGGLLFAGIKSELRVPLSGGLSGEVFYDVGDLACSASNFFKPLKTTINDQNGNSQLVNVGYAMGTGVGFRYDTPIGPLILDFAWPLQARPPSAQIGPGPTLHFAAVGSF